MFLRFKAVRVFLAALSVALLAPALANAQATLKSSRTQLYNVKLVILAIGLENPWSLAFLPDGRMLVTERVGRLRLLDANGKALATVSGLPKIAEIGQGGLMDVALHPQFSDNHLVYLSYAGRGDGGYGTEVVRGKLVENRLEDVRVIFKMEPKSQSGVHFGSRLVFDGKGHLFITLGDRGNKDRAQRLDDDAGSIVRLNDDGSIPQDNPFTKQAGARPELYTKGNRNVQGAAMHPDSGQLWADEHGPQGGDELNIIRAGANYGWPLVTAGVNYGTGTKIGEATSKAGMEQPIYTWSPSIAPSGMTFYTGDRFPQWKGNLLIGALRGRALVRLTLRGEAVQSEERMLVNDVGRIRDVRVGPDGLIYLLTDSSDGLLVRVEPIE
ncbi:MAG TPA: PQQ-dependent sugar dehydrogenase [Burkholderiales bacterium]|nr:PQQ-dependent sugar dehydrogenase [Burkholderiales bacterium]